MDADIAQRDVHHPLRQRLNFGQIGRLSPRSGLRAMSIEVEDFEHMVSGDALVLRDG